ncbi:MAG: hypothetical protein JWP20_1201 [Roseomonas sp.]|nr:hypothetical protein [Roseomonas sp.]
MPLSAGGASRSFWAAVLCLPFFLVLRVLLADAPVGPRVVVAELVGFVAGWAGYALATLPMAFALGRGPLWPRFLATWNWTSLIQYAAILGLTLVTKSGLSGWLGQGVQLAGLGYAVWLQWFATGLALKVSGGRAAGFVLLDLVLGLMVSAFVTDLALG